MKLRRLLTQAFFWISAIFALRGEVTQAGLLEQILEAGGLEPIRIFDINWHRTPTYELTPPEGFEERHFHLNLHETEDFGSKVEVESGSPEASLNADRSEERDPNYFRQFRERERRFVQAGMGNQIAFWSQFTDEAGRNLVNHLRDGLTAGNTSAFWIVNRLYHFNYELLRQLFHGELQQISEERSLPLDRIEINLDLLDRPADQSRTQTPHFDDLFSARGRPQDPEEPCKWTLVFSENRDADGTWVYYNNRGEPITEGDNQAAFSSHRTLGRASNLDWRLQRFNIHWLHSSPAGQSETRLPVHFYIVVKK